MCYVMPFPVASGAVAAARASRWVGLVAFLPFALGTSPSPSCAGAIGCRLHHLRPQLMNDY